MKNYVITGASGFIAGHLIQNLLKNEDNLIIGIDKKVQTFFHANYKHIQLNVFDLGLKIILDNNLQFLNDYCLIHLAAQTSSQISMENPCVDLESNLIGLINLIKYFETCSSKPEFILFSSSMAVYGKSAFQKHGFVETQTCHPSSVYGFTKLASEYLLQKSSIPSLSVRLFNIYGRGQDLANMKQGMLSIYLSDMIRNKKIHIKGSVDRTRDFVHVSDVVRFFIHVVRIYEEEKKFPSELVNLCSGVEVSVEKITETVLNLYSSIYKKSASKFAEGKTPGDMSRSFGDPNRLNSNFNFSTHTLLEEGLSDMISWAVNELE